MTQSQILVLADDLTGALEMGGKFASLGIPSLVTTRHNSLPSSLPQNPGALVIDTETRHLSPAEAARRVYDLARAAYDADQNADRDAGIFLLYKKTDSTLRGNIGAELAAMIEAWSGAPLLYAPAYPRLGRLVRDSSLLVDGVPVSATSFAQDPLNPVQESHIPTLLAGQCELAVLSRRPADLADRPPWSISVLDGESDADLETAALALAGSDAFRLAAGPSGLAHHLARLLDPPAGYASLLPACRDVLVVNGSLHPVSHQQIALAKQEGMGTLNECAVPIAPAAGGWTILEPELKPARSTEEFARNLGAHLLQRIAGAAYDALVVFGGDTAFALVEAMGSPPLYPIGEVMEGIPISRIERKDIATAPEKDPGKDLFLITKAGGFGPPDLLRLLRKSLNESGHG